MSLINKLERKFGQYAISNLTFYLIGGQVIAFIFGYLNPDYANLFTLEGKLILQGQWWRILTFLFSPITHDLLFAGFIWYIFYLYGSALEQQWGAFRYLIYVLIVYIGTVILAFIFPGSPLTNGYLYTSIFLAFAYLYPDYQLYLFFILPVKVKWLGVLAWIGIIGAFVFGSTSSKILTVVSISNFLFFFGNNILTSARLRLHHVSYRSGELVQSTKPYHTCAVCGRNEVADPDMQILYCNDCTPSTCYCEKHIDRHAHKSS